MLPWAIIADHDGRGLALGPQRQGRAAQRHAHGHRDLSEPIEWLATAPLAFTAEILIGILVSIPFTTTIFLGGLSALRRMPTRPPWSMARRGGISSASSRCR